MNEMKTPGTCLENRTRGGLGPLRVFGERVWCDETKGTEIRDCLVQLRKEDVDEKIIQKGRQSAQSNVRIHRYYVLQSLYEG
jgi:hypothetical protein